jgi:hypothetical protein
MTRDWSASLANTANILTLSLATKARDIMALPFRAKKWIPRTVVTPDYTNQPDLFSEAPINTPVPVV